MIQKIDTQRNRSNGKEKGQGRTLCLADARLKVVEIYAANAALDGFVRRSLQSDNVDMVSPLSEGFCITLDSRISFVMRVGEHANALRF